MSVGWFLVFALGAFFDPVILTIALISGFFFKRWWLALLSGIAIGILRAALISYEVSAGELMALACCLSGVAWAMAGFAVGTQWRS